ncbi:hypothetical protein CCUS01_14576 [Colletotrichum cuscutae]|uniref:Transmembrane protein n=1 Tax=Colletotrichum cuscutae TaxID=1209917 RepID=A0AAI9Y8S9_9PEZI|nr:hypothetical protein CCUS01_14576 [Colletotrichum cuscutae]
MGGVFASLPGMTKPAALLCCNCLFFLFLSCFFRNFGGDPQIIQGKHTETLHIALKRERSVAATEATDSGTKAQTLSPYQVSAFVLFNPEYTCKAHKNNETSRSTPGIPAWKHNSEQKVGRHVGGLLDIIRTRFRYLLTALSNSFRAAIPAQRPEKNTRLRARSAASLAAFAARYFAAASFLHIHDPVCLRKAWNQKQTIDRAQNSLPFQKKWLITPYSVLPLGTLAEATIQQQRSILRAGPGEKYSSRLFDDCHYRSIQRSFAVYRIKDLADEDPEDAAPMNGLDSCASSIWRPPRGIVVRAATWRTICPSATTLGHTYIEWHARAVVFQSCRGFLVAIEEAVSRKTFFRLIKSKSNKGEARSRLARRIQVKAPPLPVCCMLGRPHSKRMCYFGGQGTRRAPSLDLSVSALSVCVSVCLFFSVLAVSVNRWYKVRHTLEKTQDGDAQRKTLCFSDMARRLFGRRRAPLPGAGPLTVLHLPALQLDELCGRYFNGSLVAVLIARLKPGGRDCGKVTSWNLPESDPEERNMIAILPSKAISMCNLTRLERDESGDSLFLLNGLTTGGSNVQVEKDGNFFSFFLRAWLSRETAWFVLPKVEDICPSLVSRDWFLGIQGAEKEERKESKEAKITPQTHKRKTTSAVGRARERGSVLCVTMTCRRCSHRPMMQARKSQELAGTIRRTKGELASIQKQRDAKYQSPVRLGKYRMGSRHIKDGRYLGTFTMRGGRREWRGELSLGAFPASGLAAIPREAKAPWTPKGTYGSS